MKKSQGGRHFRSWRQARLFLLNGGNLTPDDYPRRQDPVEQYLDFAPETRVEVIPAMTSRQKRGNGRSTSSPHFSPKIVLSETVFAGANNHSPFEFYRSE